MSLKGSTERRVCRMSYLPAVKVLDRCGAVVDTSSTVSIDEGSLEQEKSGV